MKQAEKCVYRREEKKEGEDKKLQNSRKTYKD